MLFRSFAEAALEEDVDLELQVGEVPVVVEAQADLLVEALANLIDNAMKSAGRKGQVLVAVIATPAALRVCDNGPGIKPSERKLVFERYARGARPRWEGTGLGLAIVQSVIADHDGTIAVESREGSGATFVIMLPKAGESKL